MSDIVVPERGEDQVDAWFIQKQQEDVVTNRDLVELLSMLPPDERPLLVRPESGIGITTGLRFGMLSVGDKSRRLYIENPPKQALRPAIETILAEEVTCGRAGAATAISYGASVERLIALLGR